MSSTKKEFQLGEVIIKVPKTARDEAKKNNANLKNVGKNECKHCAGSVWETKVAILPKDHNVFGRWYHLTCVAFRCNAENLEAITGFANLKKKDKDTLIRNLVVEVVHIQEQVQPEQLQQESEEAQAHREEVRVRDLWNEHSQKVINNMHKLAKLTYDELARKLEMDVGVLRDCVRHYFKHEVYVSEEVASMGKHHPGNQPETFTGKTNEDEYPTNVEVTLHEAIQVVSLTKVKSFKEICSEHKMSLKELKDDVNFVISFGISILGEQRRH